MKEKSTKRIRFERVAGNRVKIILKTLDSLEKCSNKNNYEYYEKDVNKMIRSIKLKLKEIENSFRKDFKDNQSKFSF
jgi:hypothetical protein